MNQRLGNNLHNSTGSSERAADTLTQSLLPGWNPTYEQALQVTRTVQERTFVSVMAREHAKLGRAPTLHELKSALAGTSLDGLSKDRLSQIKRNLVILMPEGVNPILFTRDRPLFRHLARARAEYEKFVCRHKQPPTFPELRALLAKSGVQITETSLRNILKRLRKTATPDGNGFRVSRHRIGVTTSQIEGAYRQAAEYLRGVGITKAPCAALVVKFLHRAGHSLRRETLEYRFENVPELRPLTLSPHFDPGDKIITKTHKRLRNELGRDPTTKELTSECNKLSLERARPDNVWMRVSRLNKKLPVERRMSFSDTFGSGIYDVDLKRVADAATARLGRPPTLKELRKELLSSIEDSDISADATHRRARRLGIPLTSEHSLTKEHQLLIARKIQELSALFGRRPFGSEVRAALQRDGILFSQKEFNTTLGSAKRHRGEDFRTAVRLGFPGHLAGKLRKQYDALRRSMDEYPDARLLAEHLGWTVAGVESALPEAQARAARFRDPPVVLSNTPQAAALGALGTIVRELGASLAASRATDAPATTAVSGDNLTTLTSMIQGWEIPTLPIGDVTIPLTFDQKLVRCEQWWVLITCLQAPPIQVAEEIEIEARHFEAKLAKALGVKKHDENPFEGFVQVLRVAQESGRLSRADYADIMKQVEASRTIATAYGILRDELMSLARQCGFPNPTSVRQKQPVTKKRPLGGS